MLPSVQRLLFLKGSRLAVTLRHGLHGLRATLEAAHRDWPDDSGAGACQEVMEDLAQLLDMSRTPQTERRGGGAALAPHGPFDARFVQPTPPAPQPLLLAHLREAFLADDRVRAALGHVRVTDTSDEELWADVQYALLRMPESLANEWRQHALELARAVGADADAHVLQTLPLHRDEMLYPGLTGMIHVPGLRVSAQAPLCVGGEETVSSAASTDLETFARIVAFYIQWIEIDRTLSHALENVSRFGVKSLQETEQRAHYVKELVYRLERAKEAEGAPMAMFRTRFFLDEAIHGLVHTPPADPTSWWGKLQSEVRTAVFRAADHARQSGTVELRQLRGAYTDVRNFTNGNNLEVDHGGSPGEVVACLRMYARIGSEEVQGRVLYRPRRSRG
jgi:hypothetical protein